MSAKKSPDGTVRLSLAEAITMCEAAAQRAGARPETARSLAAASVAAEAEGQPSVGLAHFVDYLEALKAGRIDGRAVPELTSPALAIILSDARGGAAHPGFDAGFERLADTARTFGLALFAQRNAYTCGALGYFTKRLADRGLVALAATNGPALLAGSGSKKPVFCTNPLAFAAPVDGGAPLLIDQASSATAFVNIRQAAREGRAIPEGWAIDAGGRPTTDASEAVKGALLAFGGARGANIALMVEVLTAGVCGATWSLDAPSFTSGGESPGSGLFVVAINAEAIDPGFGTRMAAHMARLSGDYGVHVPGPAKAEASRRAQHEGLRIPAALHQRIRDWARPAQ